MKCDEVQTLRGPCLDSELDAKTSLEIERHLAACPACARLFAEEEKLWAWITASLNRGSRTAALWEQIEREVTAGASSAERLRLGRRRSAERRYGVGWSAALGTLRAQFRAGWQHSRWAWGGLAGGVGGDSRADTSRRASRTRRSWPGSRRPRRPNCASP
jgi:anti-sigma factor RsiW